MVQDQRKQFGQSKVCTLSYDRQRLFVKREMGSCDLRYSHVLLSFKLVFFCFLKYLNSIHCILIFLDRKIKDHNKGAKSHRSTVSHTPGSQNSARIYAREYYQDEKRLTKKGPCDSLCYVLLRQDNVNVMLASIR